MSEQLSLPGIPKPKTRITNVASVPHRSPFRYPGGKTWLVPRLRGWLASLHTRPGLFIEPFAGGGILSLTVAFESLADSVIMVELDRDVAAVWQAILGDEAEALAEWIMRFDLTAQAVDDLLNISEPDTLTHAMQTIVRNRVNHGGILASGSGRIKKGENGRGLASRWYPSTLAKRIRAIQGVRERITFIHGDAFDVIRSYQHVPGAAFLIDPPYTAGGKRAGARLYTHYEIDHKALFHLTKTVTGDFLMTYDNNPEVTALADQSGFVCQPIAMKNTHHARLTELLIGRNLGWL